MNNQPMTFGIIGVLLGAFIVWGVTTNTVNNQNVGMMGMMGFRNGSAQVGNMGNSVMDAHFIEQMIPHHEDAITMAKLALEKSKKDEIKTLSNNIIDSQSREIDQMRFWYKSWYGKSVPAGSQVMGQHGMMGSSGMHMGRMNDKSDMERLSQAENFDKVFIEEMIPHHQMAVMMASMLKNGTNRPEMKQLAKDIITAQTSEIDQMRDWYKSWGY